MWHVTLPVAKPGLIAASVVVFTLTVTDFAMPEILGGGTTDFIANAIYDAFFQISDKGFGSALSIILVALGSVLVALIFALAGAGTLSFVAEKRKCAAAARRRASAASCCSTSCAWRCRR